jgi:hypothetical protein
VYIIIISHTHTHIYIYIYIYIYIPTSSFLHHQSLRHDHDELFAAYNTLITDMITFINPLIKQDHDEPNEALVLFLAKDTTVAKASIRLRSRLACALREHSARYILTPEFKSALIATTGTTCALCSKLWPWAKSGLHYIFIQIQEIYSMFMSFFKIEVTKNMRGFNKKNKDIKIYLVLEKG